jgi:hypothetical protein
MKKILFAVCVLLFSATSAMAIELVRQKNAATYIFFPIVDADGDIVSSATALDSEADTFADGTAPDGFADLTNEATEIGTSGWYYISLTQAEMNYDYIAIRVQTTSSGAKTQHILIRTTVGDPLNAATNTSGYELGVASDGDLVKVNTLDGHTAQTGDAYAIVNNGTYGNAAIENLVDDIGAAGAGLTSVPTLVWETNVSAYSGAGYAGTYLKSAYDKLPTNYIMGSAVVTSKDDEIDAILVDTAAYDTDAEYATAIWNAQTASYGTSGTYGLAVEDVLADTSAFDTAGEYADAIWNAATATYGSAGTYGLAVEDIDTNTTSILTDTAAYDTDAEYAAAIWGASLSSYTTDGTFGGDFVDADDSATAQDIADAVWASVIDSDDGSLTAEEIQRMLAAFVGGETTGGGTGTVTFYRAVDTDQDETACIVMTVDSNGNRTAVVIDVADIP